jgi:two-component system cell cycle response regulator
MSALILIVDDVPTNVALLEAKLSGEYYDVLSATSGAVALDLARTENPDLILLDVMMPGMDGFEVCRQLKADTRTAHIPVVMVTALDQPSDRVAGLEAGADDFLTKPVDDMALFARLRSLLRLKMMMDELRMREATGSSMGAIAPGEVAIDGPLRDASILVVEDRVSRGARLCEMVMPLGTVTIETDPHKACKKAETLKYDLIIVSLNLAEVDGLRVCSHVRSNESTRHIPLLVLADENDTPRLIRALDIGVNDYVVRPVEPNELLARACNQIRRKRISDQLRANFHLSLKLAVTDAVTGLYNRHYMSNHLDTLMARACGAGKTVSLMLMDIDFFKSVNDRFGHAVGDEVLREFAQRVQRNVRGIDLASRYGGEEFVVIMPDTGLSYAVGAAERINRQIAAEPFAVNGAPEAIAITVSIGLAASNRDTTTSERLLERADAALYQAKRDGRNRVVTAVG